MKIRIVKKKNSGGEGRLLLDILNLYYVADSTNLTSDTENYNDRVNPPIIEHFYVQIELKCTSQYLFTASSAVAPCDDEPHDQERLRCGLRPTEFRRKNVQTSMTHY